MEQETKKAKTKWKYPPEAYIISVLAIIVTVLMLAQIIGRYCFGNAISWSEEGVRYLFVWIVMLGASYATRERANIGIETFVSFLPRRGRIAVETAATILWCFICIYITYISFEYTMFTKASNAMSTVLGIPLVYIYMAIPVGFALMSVRIIINYAADLKQLRDEKRKPEAGEGERT